MMRSFILVATVALGACLGFGCIADTGTPDYSSHVGLIPEDMAGEEPDPFQPGDQRLAFGVFYEGESSDQILINNVTTNYFIFVTDQNNPGATLTYDQGSSSDRLEGSESAEISLRGLAFWGGGIIWDEPFDLSEWTTMFVSFKSSDPSFETFNISLQSGPNATGVDLDPRDYGYVNDGEWHSLEIPLQDAIDLGFDIGAVRSPFIIGGPGGAAGDELLVDNLYYTND